MESKPISFVMRMPKAVSRPAWAHAELMRPSSMSPAPVEDPLSEACSWRVQSNRRFFRYRMFFFKIGERLADQVVEGVETIRPTV